MNKLRITRYERMIWRFAELLDDGHYPRRAFALSKEMDREAERIGAALADELERRIGAIIVIARKYGFDLNTAHRYYRLLKAVPR